MRGPLLRAGAVFWGPPKGAIAEAVAHAHEPLYSAYGPDEGLPELRAALQRKIEQENGLRGVELLASMLHASGTKPVVVARRTHGWRPRRDCVVALQTKLAHEALYTWNPTDMAWLT